MNEPPRILIAASGSGGHLFPARFIAAEILQLRPDAQIAFIGSGRPLEDKLIDKAGFTRFVLPLEQLRGRGLRGLVSLFLSLPKAVIATWRLISNFKPDVVVGVGGYVSVLPVLLARLRGLPSWIHEAEAHAGKANALLSFAASRISVAFEEVKIPRRSKTVYTGHPVREELRDIQLDRDIVQKPSKLLIIGGSQGAKGLDDGVTGLASFLSVNGIEVVHQSRPENIEFVSRAYTAAGVKGTVVSFVEDMAGAYVWADVVVSRAGAASVAELAVVGKPSVLVPFPFAQGGHQVVNAMVLVRRGKALLCEEGPGFTERLREALEAVFDPVVYEEMRARPVDKTSLSAAKSIAEGILALAAARRRP